MASVPDFNLYQPAHKAEAPSKQYRHSAYTVRQFARLPHALQMEVDIQEGLKDAERKKPNAG